MPLAYQRIPPCFFLGLDQPNRNPSQHLGIRIMFPSFCFHAPVIAERRGTVQPQPTTSSLPSSSHYPRHSLGSGSRKTPATLLHRQTSSSRDTRPPSADEPVKREKGVQRSLCPAPRGRSAREAPVLPEQTSAPARNLGRRQQPPLSESRLERPFCRTTLSRAEKRQCAEGQQDTGARAEHPSSSKTSRSAKRGLSLSVHYGCTIVRACAFPFWKRLVSQVYPGV